MCPLNSVRYMLCFSTCQIKDKKIATELLEDNFSNALQIKLFLNLMHHHI